MVFLALTAAGLQEALALQQAGKCAIWCGADAISEADYAALSGADVSRFSDNLCDEGGGLLPDALQTIAEHHPGERIWVEQSPASV